MAALIQDPLFAPYIFRSGAAVTNRVTLAPLTNLQSDLDGVCGMDELRWLERRAQGGFSVVMTCASHISPTAQAYTGELACFDGKHLSGLAELAASLHKHGALSLVQLFHGGARSSSKVTGIQPISASAWIEQGTEFESPRAATVDEIEQIVDDFCAAAHLAHRAGFGGIELHGAHGYLFSQFLSTVRNTRSDRFGGSLEGRARLLRKVARRIRAEVPAPFIVGVRLSPETLPSVPGLDLDDTLQVAQWLAEDGVDFIDLSLWNYARKSLKRPQEHPLPMFRAALPREVAIFAGGRIWNRADAETVLGLGADFVSLGRAAIVEPDWPKLAREPDFESRRGPLTPAQYAEIAVSPRYVEYLRTFPNMVSG